MERNAARTAKYQFRYRILARSRRMTGTTPFPVVQSSTSFAMETGV
jgi:hypothetical protein